MTGNHEGEPCTHHGVGRRSFLGLAGASLATTGLATMLGAAPASAAPLAGAGESGTGLRFGIVSDTHINTTSPQSTTWLTWVWAAMARRSPDLVLHCGDVTDTGLPDEYDRYGQILPDALRGRIHYSPGNHEMRWDATAKELYHAHFGPAPYSFDAGGVHFVGVDPTQVLQEPGHYGSDTVRWLDRDLRALAPHTPTVLFQHYPMGSDFYFVDDQPAVFDLFARHNVRGVFAGHIHREDVAHFNGLTQVGLNAVLNGPIYYWVTKTAGADGTPQLQVTRVTVAADGTETETPLTTMPLAGDGQGRPQRPRLVRFGAVTSGTLPVTVELDPAAAPSAVSVQRYPQTVFGDSSPFAWQPLAGAAGDGRWTGTVDVSSVAPGRQRLQVQVLAQDGTYWQDVDLYSVPGTDGDPAQRWEHPLRGAVQGGVAVVDAERGTVAAGSTDGDLVALRVRGPVATPLWRTRVGPVYRRPGVDAAGRTLFVPSSDHHLYAVDAASGRQRWRFDAGAPVLSGPTVATVGGRETVLFAAGQALFAVTANTGQLLWTVPGRGFSSGQAACDGTLVHTAAADGYARAHDAATGAPVWSYQMVSGVEHHVLPYSGWDCAVAIGDGVAVVATVSGATALDAATGAVRWTLSGSTMYAPAVPLSDGGVLLTTEYGVVTKVDMASGTHVWQTSLGVRVFNAGVAVRGDTAWVMSVDGKVIGVRLSDGQRLGWFQHSLVYTFSRPAVVGDTLVVGDQNGVLHGIVLP